MKNHIVVVFLFCNLDEAERIAEYIYEEIDTVYHLAWGGVSGDDRGNYHLQIKNVEQTLNLITAASKLGCKRFVGVGSTAEYDAYNACKEGGSLYSEEGENQMDNTILSICIPLHNRSETVIEHVEELLKYDNPKFDIVISDTSDDGKDFLSFWRKTDPRVSVVRFPVDTLPEENWRIAMERADGVFAMHLNDRDLILKEGLSDLLDFLENHSDFSGGICKYIPTNPEPLIFKGRNEALMGVPYFASHVQES